VYENDDAHVNDEHGQHGRPTTSGHTTPALDTRMTKGTVSTLNSYDGAGVLGTSIDIQF
jgi:hypothetical protein